MAKKNRKFRTNTNKDTWNPGDDKADLNIIPGTAEYGEYLEDRKTHTNVKPDDVFHNELEKRNIAVRANRRDDNKSHLDKNKEHKTANRTYKIAKANELKKELAEKAKETPESYDDDFVKKMDNASLNVYDADEHININEVDNDIPGFGNKYF